MGMSAFDRWFWSHEWFHEGSAKTRLSEAWDALRELGMGSSDAALFLNNIVSVLRNEYGE